MQVKRARVTYCYAYQRSKQIFLSSRHTQVLRVIRRAPQSVRLAKVKAAVDGDLRAGNRANALPRLMRLCVNAEKKFSTGLIHDQEIPVK